MFAFFLQSAFQKVYHIEIQINCCLEMTHINGLLMSVQKRKAIKSLYSDEPRA